MRAFILLPQWSPTLCDPMDCSLAGSSVHGILQTRILLSSRAGLLDPEIEPRCPATSALQADSLSLSHQRSPLYEYLLQIQSLLSDYCRINEYACLSTKHKATGLTFAPTVSLCQPNRLLVLLLLSRSVMSISLHPWWLRDKESTCQYRKHGFDPWITEIPYRKKWQPTPVSLPGKPHGKRSLMGYRLLVKRHITQSLKFWIRKEKKKMFTEVSKGN